MLTTRQKLVVVIALIESFCLSAHYAVFMPFYPIVANHKGNTASQVGAFFAVGSLVGLLGSTFFGWLMKKGVPPKTLVVNGVFLSGICLLMHGFYNDLFEDGEDFFYANFITRIVHSIGPVCATTAIYPIIAVELEEKRGTYLPLLEASYNIGLMIWPSIGSILYEQFGYTFPFTLVGASSLLMGVLILTLLPPTKDSSDELNQEKIGFKKIDFSLTLILLNITLCYLIIGFNDITLSTELAKLHLNHTQIGYCFAVCTVCYGLWIYLWGFVCESVRGRYYAQALGCLLSIAALFFSAPCVYFGIEPTVAVRLVGQGLLGTGLAGLFTSSMISGMHYLTENLDLPDDVATHGFFSGLIFFSLSFGYLIGHGGFAGVLLETLGYELVLCVIASVLLTLLIVNFCNLVFRAAPKLGYDRI